MTETRTDVPGHRLFALSRALAAAWRPRAAAGYAAGIVAALAVELGDAPLEPLLAGLAFLAVALAAQATLLRGRLRAATEAFCWLGRWEWLRARREVVDPFPATPRAMRAAANADLPVHPASVELLAYAGELERARAMASRLPTDTPWERFERAAGVAWLEWLTTGRHDDAAARSAAAELAEDGLRQRAAVALALGDARAAVVGDGDWMPPLVAVRRELGAEADGILRHEWWRERVVRTVAIALVVALAAWML